MSSPVPGGGPDAWAPGRLAALFVASTSSRVSASAADVALVLFVLDRTGSPGLVGAVVAARSLPSLLVGPVTGAWLDRTHHRKGAFVGAQVLLLLSLTSSLFATGRTSGVVLVLLGLLAGLTSPVLTAGFTGLIPLLVPVRVLQRAYGAEAASYNVAGIAGPAVAGALSAVASPFVALTACCALLLLALLALLPLRLPPDVPGVARATLGRTVQAGLHHLVRTPVLRAVTAGTTLSMVGYGAVPVTFPLFAEALGGRREDAGLLFSAFALGALLGSVQVAVRPTRREPARRVLTGLGLLGVGFAVLSVAPSLPVALAVIIVLGMVEGPVLAATLSVRAQQTPGRLLNQVGVTAASLKGGAFALGSAVTGVVVAGAGARSGLLVLVAANMLGLVVGLTLQRERRSRPVVATVGGDLSLTSHPQGPR